MTESNQRDPDDAVLRIAERLDAASVEGLDPAELTAIEREELNRVQFALDFIHSVCPPPASPSARETPRTNAGQATLRNSSRDRSAAGRSDSHPTRLGRFQIRRLLGQGGFARVFLAYDPQLNRNVALKLLRGSPFFATDASLRLEREAQAAAILNHPSIVPVYEAGTLDGQQYIASAFVDGTTLEQYLDQFDGTVPTHQAAQLIANLADAVHHAHQRGIIHRDLKPANILLAGIDQEPRSALTLDNACIADFGLAKHPGGTDQMETAEGAIVGTPAYMSPEQAAGSTEIGAASDIYSLGVMLYELLTGQVPILGRNHVETLLAIKQQAVQSPRQRRPELPRDLEAICLKCLEKDPKQRYESAFALATDLRQWITGGPVEARQITAFERGLKWTRRNPVLATMLAALTAALLLASYQWRAASIENQRANRHLALSQDVIDEVVSQVATDPALPNGLRRRIAQRAVDLQEQLRKEVPSDVNVAAKTMRAHNRLSTLLYDLGDFNAALTVAEDSIAIGKPFGDNAAISVLRMSAVQIRSGVLTSLERGSDSAAALKEAESKLPQPDISKPRSRFAMAMALMQEGRFEDANKEFQQALDLTAAMDDNPMRDIEMARIQFYWGRSDMKMGSLASARDRTNQALQRYAAAAEGAPRHDAITEDHARCYLQLAEISLAECESAEPDAIESLRGDARTALTRSAELFQQLISGDSLIHRAYGQLAYVLQLKLMNELELRDDEAAVMAIEPLSVLFASMPQEIKHRQAIGQVLAEARMVVGERLFENDNADSARVLFTEARQLLVRLLEDYPDADELNPLLVRCDENLAATDANQ